MATMRPVLQQRIADEIFTYDTIPSSLKPYFFLGKKQPDLLREYDVIGFDVNHCLVKYNEQKLIKQIVKGHLSELVECQLYPEQTTAYDYEKQLGFQNYWLSNAVWDIENGTILKLGDNMEVTHAILGFEKLTGEQICEIYGNPPIFKNLLWPKTNKFIEKEIGAHWTFMGFFDHCKIPVICQIVHLIQ